MSELVALVCTLPEQYKKQLYSSPKDVVRMLKLKKHRSEVSAEEIFTHLNENKHLLEVWMRWSNDKRWSPSWYFVERKPNWVVGKIPDGPELLFDDPVQACTQFIEIELDEILSRL